MFPCVIRGFAGETPISKADNEKNDGEFETLRKRIKYELEHSHAVKAISRPVLFSSKAFGLFAWKAKTSFQMCLSIVLERTGGETPTDIGTFSCVNLNVVRSHTDIHEVASRGTPLDTFTFEACDSGM